MVKNTDSNLYQIVKIAERQKKDGKFDSEEIQQYLNDKMRLRVITCSKTISIAADKKKYVHYILRGMYFHYRIAPNGKLHILSKKKAPDWIGMDKAFVPQEANETEDHALTECVVLDIREDYLRECIQEDGAFALYIVKELLIKMSKISRKSDLFVFNNARERLLLYILEYWELYSKKSNTCRFVLKNSYIADELGITTRTLYRELDKLKNEGMIVMKKGDITVTGEQIVRIREVLEENLPD